MFGISLDNALARPSTIAVLPTRFTYEHGIVLGAAGKDLNNPSNLFIAADDGIKLACRARSVSFAVTLEGLILFFGF